MRKVSENVSKNQSEIVLRKRIDEQLINEDLYN